MTSPSVRFIALFLALFGTFSSAFIPLRPTVSVWGCRKQVYKMQAKLGWLKGSTTTIEREITITTRPITEHPSVEQPQRREKNDSLKERQGTGSEAWEVRIYNDGLNTREHVARSLVQVTGLSEQQAYQTMMQAHRNGIASVGRWAYEVAEMYHDALKKKGIVCDIIPVDKE